MIIHPTPNGDMCTLPYKGVEMQYVGIRPMFGLMMITGRPRPIVWLVYVEIQPIFLIMISFNIRL